MINKLLAIIIGINSHILEFGRYLLNMMNFYLCTDATTVSSTSIKK